jgi:galactokinase
MTGGGFGGCTVNLVQRELVERFRDSVADEYERKTGITPATYLVQADRGADEVSEASC